MYEKILLPTDGSPAMGSIIEQGIYQALQSGATVHALYVIDVRSYMMLPDETGDHVARLLEEEGTRAIDTIRQQAEENDVEFVGEVVVGVPHESILMYADENDVELIVMGTHGRSGEEKRIVGSVAEEVVRNATAPVLIVRMSEVERQKVTEEISEEQRRYIR